MMLKRTIQFERYGDGSLAILIDYDRLAELKRF